MPSPPALFSGDEERVNHPLNQRMLTYGRLLVATGL